MIIYPTPKIRNRPFFIEIDFHGFQKSIRLFKANYLYSEEEAEQIRQKHPLVSIEGHPWNLSLEGDLVDDRYPNATSFWREDFVKWVVDAMNDKYERENKAS